MWSHRNGAYAIVDFKRFRRNQRMAWSSKSKSVVSRILERDGHKCTYCGATDNLSVDHIVPISRGGLHDDSNLVTACRECNSGKGNKTVAEWEQVKSERIAAAAAKEERRKAKEERRKAKEVRNQPRVDWMNWAVGKTEQEVVANTARCRVRFRDGIQLPRTIAMNLTWRPNIDVVNGIVTAAYFG